MNGPADLLVECDKKGVRLSPATDGRLAVDAPRDALTSEFVERLRVHKADLLVMLTATQDAAADDPPAVVGDRPRCDKCRSVAWRDVSIHEGESVRRDCARCGRFIAFPVWHGRPLAGTCNS